MGSQTYTTPVIPFADFADYNPGHGTDTVRETMRSLRDTYAVARIKQVVTSAGIQFVVTGEFADIVRLAALYNQNVNGLPLAVVTDEQREHAASVDTRRLGEWLNGGMYRPYSALWVAAMDELHGRADDEAIERRWGLIGA